jgi:hypothetical protein
VINNSSRDLNGFGLTTTHAEGGGSVETCVVFCSTKNFTFAGVQNG